MKKICLALILINLQFGGLTQASPTKVIQIKNKLTILGFGMGSFPKETIKSTNGIFKVLLPSGQSVRRFDFSENYDSMCDVSQLSKMITHSFVFSIRPSSAEASQCVLNVELSNGKIIQLVGLFATGD